jgi:hypothetical protein
VTTCEECIEIAREIKQCYGQLKSLLDDTQDDRLRVAEALRRGDADAQVIEEFFDAQAPRLRPGAYPGMVQAMTRKFDHERRTGHVVRLD